MLIKEIEPIGNIGVNLLDKANETIEEIIELPLRKAIKRFREKGIQTVMSSANKNNLTKLGEKPKEKEDIHRKNEYLFDSKSAPSFEDAGVGYAWIMLDFESLADENKDFLFSMEEKTGEKGIWFVHPFPRSNLYYDLKSGKIDYEYLKTLLPEEKMPPRVEKDERLAKFEAKSIILSYNNRYPAETVIVRMPINETSTVEEVEDYFYKFAEAFKEQNIDRKQQMEL